MTRARNRKAAQFRPRGWRHWHLLGIALGLLALLPGCWNGRDEEMSHQAVAVGGVLCPDPTWSVGLVHPEEQRHLSHTFTLQNQTDKPIPIEQVKSSCGCLVAKDRPKEIPAHGSVGMEVSLNLSPVPGVFHHTTQVKLGVTEPATLIFKTRGVAAPTGRLYASPPSLDFGRLCENETRTRKVRISRYDFSRVDIARLTSDIDGCTLDAELVSDEDATLLSVTIDGKPLRPGSHSGIVVVETSHPVYPSLQIPIKMEVGTIAEAFVPSLLIEAIAPGAHRPLCLYRPGLAGADQPKIARLEYKGDPDLRLETFSTQEPDGVEMPGTRLSVSPASRVGSIKKGAIHLVLDSPTSSHIEVPLIVFVK